MRYNILAGIAATALVAFAAPAYAGDWSENVGICAAAAEAEGIVASGEYRAKFLRGSGASTKTVAVELTTNGGDEIVAECKIRRGEVTNFAVKA